METEPNWLMYDELTFRRQDGTLLCLVDLAPEEVKNLKDAIDDMLACLGRDWIN